MTKLNAIIAIEKSVKAKTHSELTNVYQVLQKPALLAGLSRVYQPVEDEGENLPSESTKVQLKASESVKAVQESLSKLFDVVAAKDWTNCRATADIVVDDRTLMTGVPATYLLFLEKQLVDLKTFVKKLPTLDQADTWALDSTGTWVTKPVETVRTKKVPKAFVKAPATENHPAQVDVFHEDITVGHWKTTKMSGAMPQTEVAAMLERLEKLEHAVKFAREEANGSEVQKQEGLGKTVLSYVFGG